MKNMVVKFGGALISTIVFSIITFGLSDVIDSIDSIVNIGGDKATVFALIYFSLPLGGVTGILLTDRIFCGLDGYNPLGFVLGFILSSIVGTSISTVLLDRFGSFAFLIIYLVILITALIGYHLPQLAKKSGLGSEA